MKLSTRDLVVIPATAMVLLLSTGLANAATLIDSCSDSITQTEGKLVLDLVVTGAGQDCLTIPSGKNLNMNGYSIICASGTGDCGTAIRAAGSGTKIYDGSSSGGGSVVGSGAGVWTLAIQGATQVKDIRLTQVEQAIDDSDPNTGNRVDRAKKILRNFFLCFSMTRPCVDVIMDRGTDLVQDNIFSGANAGALSLAGKGGGANGPTIDNNLFQFGITGAAVKQVGASNRFRAFNNTFDTIVTAFDVESSIVSQVDRCDANFWSGNVCEDFFWCGNPPTDCQDPPAQCSCTNGGTPYCDASGVTRCAP